MTKSKPIMFAILTATLLISTVSLNEVFASFNDIADINTDKCMGCGLCAVTCPNDAITLDE